MSEASDPFGQARRAMLSAPMVGLVGAAVIALAIAAGGGALLLLIPGGLLLLHSLARFLIAFYSLRVERRRQRLLREGTPATATLRSVEQRGQKFGHQLFVADLEVQLPTGETRTITRRGAVEARFAGEVTEGATVPVRIDPDDPSTVVIAWDEL